ncbi:MAG: metal-dependent hydrolase [Gemmatimonadota bacterium]
MASAISHALAAAGIGFAFLDRRTPARVWVVAAAAAIAPDLDVIGYRLGVPYESIFGHRGLSHSLLAAALIAGVLTFMLRRADPNLSTGRLFGFFALAVTSHGFLDGFTNGGLGVAFFAPIDSTRYFFPWRPIEVSPLSISGFFTARGLTILASEAEWIWLPTAVGATVAWMLRRRRWAEP